MERIGKIVNTHGIRGELKVESASDFLEERFKVGNKVSIKFNNNLEEFTIASFRIHKGYVLISFKGLENINFVEKYKGSIIYQELADVDLADNEYLYSDLIGKDIVDDADKKLGVVIDVLPYPSQDMLLVKNLKNQEKLIPFVGDLVLDVKEDKIVINPIEGLL